MLMGEIRTEKVSQELAYWLALNQRSYYFSSRVIVDAIGDLTLKDLWHTDRSILAQKSFSTRTLEEFDKLRAGSALQESERLLQQLVHSGINLFAYTDPSYPQQLKDLPSSVIPPLLLFHKGTLKDFSKSVAVVGTRNPTFRGRTMARKTARALAEEGYAIVSGLARGIDVEAHCGALEAKQGKTVAVLAWFDPIYPDEHSELVKEIESRGARISENYFKAFGSMTGAKFVERNRITSGISKCVVVIETGEDGGTIRQAELAHQEKRPIFVLSPKENERASRGFSKIVEKHGGTPFKDPDDLLDKINSNQLRPEKTLSRYSLDDQTKLS